MTSLNTAAFSGIAEICNSLHRVFLQWLPLSCLALLLSAPSGCSKDAEEPVRAYRNRFVLEFNSKQIDVSIPEEEGDNRSGTYRIRFLGTEGAGPALTGIRKGRLEDAWFTDLDRDGDVQILVWTKPESGTSQIDCFDQVEAGWKMRSLPGLSEGWRFEVKRGILFATSAEGKKPAGRTFSVAENRWLEGLPQFE